MSQAVTTKDFKSKVLDFKGKVLVDFWATWCGPCQMLAPIIDEIAAEVSPDKVKVVKVDVDKQQALASEHGVVSIPTVLIFDHGQKVVSLVGFRQKQEYLQALG
ncbi:MAG: thioredoxin [Patescibacteria group bacterium]